LLFNEILRIKIRERVNSLSSLSIKEEGKNYFNVNLPVLTFKYERGSLNQPLFNEKEKGVLMYLMSFF